VCIGLFTAATLVGDVIKFILLVRFFKFSRYQHVNTIQYNTIQLNVLVPSLQKHGRLCITMLVNMWDNSYEEKAQLK